MKAISIRQPWASLTAAGIRDIDISNRDTKYRGPILLVASSRRVGRDFGHDVPIDWYCRVRNAQALGLLPYDEEMPLSCAVGVAQLVDCNTQIQDSPWSATGNNWVLRDARLFSHPISGVKGKQGLFDVPEIKEDQLNETFEQITPWSDYKNGIFSISMTEMEIERQLPGWPITLMICEDGLAAPILFEEENHIKLKEIKQIRLVSSTYEILFNVVDTQIYKEKEPYEFQYIAFELE